MSRWIYSKTIYCSNCNVTTERVTPYCPWCGMAMTNFDERRCDAFHIENGRPVCWGTKEKDVCNCNGFSRKCDFYDEVRNR